MANEIKVYKVRDKSTGEYRTAGGGWSRTGKTWNNLGHLKSSIAAEGWYNMHALVNQLPSNDIEIVEVIIREDVGTTSPMRDLVIAERKKRALSKKFGGDFATLIERIELAGQNNDFQWVLIVSGSYDWKTRKPTGDIVELYDLLKRMKLKQNKDYKKASSGGGGAFAFASKQVAMMARLQLKGKVQSIDIVKYVETDLDEEASSSV